MQSTLTTWGDEAGTDETPNTFLEAWEDLVPNPLSCVFQLRGIVSGMVGSDKLSSEPRTEQPHEVYKAQT